MHVEARGACKVCVPTLEHWNEEKDMVAYLGSQSKVSEVLNYKRPLSLTMIRALNHGLGIPAEVLLQDPVRMHRGTLP